MSPCQATAHQRPQVAHCSSSSRERGATFEAQVLQGINLDNHESRALAEPVGPRLMVCAGHTITILLEFVEAGRFVASDEEDSEDSESGSGDDEGSDSEAGSDDPSWAELNNDQIAGHGAGG